MESDVRKVTKPQVVVAGHICLDITPDMSQMKIDSPEDFLHPGQLRQVDSPSLSTGGAVSNTGLALLRLGISSILMGKIGKDPFGDVILKILKDRWKINQGMIITPGEGTSYSIVLTPGNYDRMFLHYPGANNTFVSDDIRYDVVSDASLFHFGYPPLMEALWKNDGKELVDMFKRVKDLHVTTSLDMACPDPNSPAGKIDWKLILSKTLPYVDIFLPSAEEILFMLNPARYRELWEASKSGGLLEAITESDIIGLGSTLLEMGVKIAGIKCGTRGIYLRTAPLSEINKIKRPGTWNPNEWADKERWEPVYLVEDFVNATGAGDAAIAGFLAAFIRGYSVDYALRFAAAAGACNVMAPDTLSGIMSWDETVALVRSGWPKRPFKITTPGWIPISFGQWAGPQDQAFQ